MQVRVIAGPLQLSGAKPSCPLFNRDCKGTGNIQRIRNPQWNEEELTNYDGIRKSGLDIVAIREVEAAGVNTPVLPGGCLDIQNSLNCDVVRAFSVLGLLV